MFRSGKRRRSAAQRKKTPSRSYQVSRDGVRRVQEPLQLRLDGQSPKKRLKARKSVIRDAGDEIRTSFLETVYSARGAVRDAFGALFGAIAAIRFRSVAKVLLYGAAAMLVCAVQTTLFSRLTLFGLLPVGITPQLALAFVIAMAAEEGESAGGAIGIFTGYVAEAVGSTGVPLMPLFFMLAGYLTGTFVTHVTGKTVPAFYFAAFVFEAANAVLTLFLFAAYRADVNIFSALITVSLPELGLSMLFAILPYLLARVLVRVFREKPIAQLKINF